MASIVLALRCQHCGGRLHPPDWYDEIFCSVCSREHTLEGKLVIPEVKYVADYLDRTPQQGIDVPRKGRE